MPRAGFDPSTAERFQEKRRLLDADLPRPGTRDHSPPPWARFKSNSFKMALSKIIVAGLFASSVWSLTTPKNTLRDSIPIINVDWQDVVIESKTSTTLQVVVNPMLL